MSQKKIKLRAILVDKYEVEPKYYTDEDQGPGDVTVNQMIEIDEEHGPLLLFESPRILEGNVGEFEFFVQEDSKLSVKDSLRAVERIREMCHDELIHPAFRAILAFRIGEVELGRVLFDQDSSKYVPPPDYYLQYELTKSELDRVNGKQSDLRKFVAELSEKYPANLELKKVLEFMGSE